MRPSNGMATRSPDGTRCGSAIRRHSTAFMWAAFICADVVHEQELGEVIVDARALQVLAGTQVLACGERRAAHLLVNRGARRPCLAPVVPVAIDAVTSSKSVSDTPLATKRGPQWEMAEAIRASVMAVSWRLWFRCARRAGPRARRRSL